LLVDITVDIFSAQLYFELSLTDCH